MGKEVKDIKLLGFEGMSGDPGGEGKAEPLLDYNHFPCGDPDVRDKFGLVVETERAAKVKGPRTATEPRGKEQRVG